MIYTLSKGVTKEEFIAAAGFLIFVTSLPLFVGLGFAGIVHDDVFRISLICVGACVIGFMMGAKIRTHINEKTFRYILLTFFSVAGLRLLITEMMRLMA